MKTTILLLALLLLLPIQGDADPDKIPITTTSPKALESFLRARDLSERLQGQESIQHYEKAIAADPDFAQAHLLFSLVQPSAKAFFSTLAKARALADQVSEGERLWILGFEAGVNGFPLKQRQYYQQLVELFPQDERAHNLFGNHFFGQQDYEKAITEYEKSLAINPDFSQPYNQLGYARRFLGDFVGAREAFEKYIELIPDDPNPRDSYAELLMKTGDYDASITAYRKALNLNPNFVASHIGIATNLNFKGEHAAARAQLKKLHSLARNDGERRAAHFATAVSHVDEGDLEAALKELQKQFAIAAALDDPAAMAGDLVVRGNILLEMGRSDDALDAYQKALDTVQASELSPEVKANNKRAFLLNSSRVALQKDDLATARDRSDEFRRQAEEIRNPLQIRLAHELAGQIALAVGQHDLAIAELRQANQQNPQNLYRIAVANLIAGGWQQARQWCDRAAAFNALNNINYAFIRHRAQRDLQAIDRLSKSIDAMR
ncbi:MAG: tetratricopeptide repeat protein [Gemmatimonadetes bacterium]|jgi:tetratricopeptide (TPR) repeat protein|nr:tetratricopeptide repeat protein [Gemmatimonadota bacterium]